MIEFLIWLGLIILSILFGIFLVARRGGVRGENPHPPGAEILPPRGGTGAMPLPHGGPITGLPPHLWAALLPPRDLIRRALLSKTPDFSDVTAAEIDTLLTALQAEKLRRAARDAE